MVSTFVNKISNFRTYSHNQLQFNIAATGTSRTKNITKYATIIYQCLIKYNKKKTMKIELGFFRRILKKEIA